MAKVCQTRLRHLGDVFIAMSHRLWFHWSLNTNVSRKRNGTAKCVLPAVGVCLPGNAAFSKRFNTGVNHALERGLSVFIWQQCELIKFRQKCGVKSGRFSACFAQNTAAEETSIRQAFCGPHLLLAFAVFVQHRAHYSQIRCPTELEHGFYCFRRKFLKPSTGCLRR